MTQRSSSVHSAVSSLSSSSAISLQQIHPTTSSSSLPSISAQPSTNLSTGYSSSNPLNTNPPPNPATSTTQASNPPTQAHPPQQSDLGSTIPNTTSTVSSSSSNNSAQSAVLPAVGPVTTKQNLTRFARYFDNWWAWEISAGLLAIICLTTILIVLAIFNGKPQPEMRWGIMLNALIALITTVMKGASLTPLMEGMNQFKWLVFAQETRPLMDFNVYDGARRGGLNALTLFWHMRRRFWREATALAALFYFLSFGVDTFVQQLIQTEYQDHVVPTLNPMTLQRAQRYDNHAQLATNQGSLMPDSPDIDMIAAIYTPLYATKSTDQSDLFSCAEGNCSYPDTPSLAVCARTNSFTDRVALIASFAYVNTTNTVIDTPKAGECALFPCVQEYRTEVRRGVMNQTVVREWSYVAPRRITNSSYEALGQWEYSDNIRISTPGLQGQSAEIGSNMSIKAFLGLQVALVPLLDGTLTQGTTGGVEGEVESSSAITQRMYATTNMTELIERVAASLTSSIRRNPATTAMPDYQHPYNNLTYINMPEYLGEALRQLPIVSIQWPWIVLPAVTVLFSNVFLVFAMIKTKQAQRSIDVGVWKSSCLSVLYHGLDANALARANVNPALSTSVAYMEENAGQLQVRFNAAGSDIKLS